MSSYGKKRMLGTHDVQHCFSLHVTGKRHSSISSSSSFVLFLLGLLFSFTHNFISFCISFFAYRARPYTAAANAMASPTYPRTVLCTWLRVWKDHSAKPIALNSMAMALRYCIQSLVFCFMA